MDWRVCVFGALHRGDLDVSSTFCWTEARNEWVLALYPLSSYMSVPLRVTPLFFLTFLPLLSPLSSVCGLGGVFDRGEDGLGDCVWPWGYFNGPLR